MSHHLAPPWPRAILHLDMDAFYVNVHILDHPEHNGIPLAVGGKPESRGVVASASYEARKLGIRSAMPMKTAVRLCRNLTIVPANWPRIHDCSQSVMEILRTYGPVEQMSVDEAYIDLSEFELPETVANEIRQIVKSQTGLPCSVGLATSKLVAKVASDFDKPEGFTVVRPGTEADFLAPMPTRALHGVGPKTAEKLTSLGIETCQQLANADLPLLVRAFKNQAESLRRRAQGIDKREVAAERGQSKSISQEWTFSQDVSDEAVLEERLKKMCGKVAQSVQKKKLLAHTVTVKFRWSDFTTITRQRSFEVGIDQEGDIFRVAKLIWLEFWPNGRPMRLLGVGISNLQKPQMRQMSLFE